MSALPKDSTSSLIERPRSLKDAAYREIKGLMITGQLEHDKLYSAQHFAEILGVSRTPVREALLQLTSEGFLVCLDVRGFKIKEFSPKEIRDVFETREVIETFALRRLADDLASDDLRHLDDTIKAMRSAAMKRDAVAFLEADREFHMIPLRRCGNLHLLAIMENIRNYISLFGLKALHHEGRFQEVIREHSAIVAALRDRDRKRAVHAIGSHLTATESYLQDAGEAARP